MTVVTDLSDPKSLIPPRDSQSHVWGTSRHAPTKGHSSTLLNVRVGPTSTFQRTDAFQLRVRLAVTFTSRNVNETARALNPPQCSGWVVGLD